MTQQEITAEGIEELLRTNPGLAETALTQIMEKDPELYVKIARPTVDEQTGLYAKRYFENDLLEEVAHKAERNEQSLCYAIFDIDGFKQFNDQYDHETGDVVIDSVVNAITNNLRTHDAIGRVNNHVGRVGSGEEFAVILLNTTLDDAYKALDRVREYIANNRVDTKHGKLSVTVSCGVSAYKIGGDLDELRHNADKALYEAKRTGKNKVCRHKTIH